MRSPFKIIFTFILLLNAPALADDMVGSMDHPRIPRLPGYEIQGYDHNDFGSYDFFTSEGQSVKEEGKFWRIDYLLPEGGKMRGPLEITRNYENMFKSKGGDGYEGDVSYSGGTAYTWMNEDGKETWMEITISNSGEAYSLTIIEKAALQQQVELGADQITKELTEKGTISLYGILFDTAKFDIKPGSLKTLQAIAGALKNAPNMKVEVSGHTDNVGDAAYNQKLSEARAISVQKALVALGVDPARLSAKGYGDTKPLAGNDSEDGRSKNRRVQLTKL